MARKKISQPVPHMDMTPFVDVILLILMFFIMATKFKPPEPVPINAPSSVSSQPLPENNAVLIGIDKDNKVYFSIQSMNDPQKAWDIISKASEARGMPIPEAIVHKSMPGDVIGVPFSQLQSFLNLPRDQMLKVTQPGIPVADSANNELVYWIAATKQVYSGESLKYLIKGDDNAKFTTFNAVIEALKKNDEQKYNLVTLPKSVPVGSDLYIDKLQQEKQARQRKKATEGL